MCCKSVVRVLQRGHMQKSVQLKTTATEKIPLNPHSLQVCLTVVDFQDPVHY